METGVFMLFGGRRFESSSIIEAYSQTFHIPYVSPSFADNVGRHLPSYQLHMRPSHTRALVDVIEHFGWRNFHYVYDSDEGLYRIQEIIRTFESKRYKATVRMRRLVDVYNAHEELRALDKLGEAENHTDRLILLDLSREEHYHSVLKQIREVGMNKHGYCYVLGTMDFLSLEMGRYQHGGVNITGFQLVNYSSPFVQKFLGLWSELDPHIWPGAGDNSIHIDAALAVDAITVIQKTLSQLIENSSNVFKHTFRRGMVYNYNQSRGVPCDADPPIPWMHGAALMDGIRNLHFSGVTGNIEFDEYGFRKNYKFDVYNVGLNNGPNKIGEWSTRGGVYTDGEEFSRVTNTSHEGKVYVVTSVLEGTDSGSDFAEQGIAKGGHQHRHHHGEHHQGTHRNATVHMSANRAQKYKDIVQAMNGQRHHQAPDKERSSTFYVGGFVRNTNIVVGEIANGAEKSLETPGQMEITINSMDKNNFNETSFEMTVYGSKTHFNISNGGIHNETDYNETSYLQSKSVSSTSNIISYENSLNVLLILDFFLWLLK